MSSHAALQDTDWTDWTASPIAGDASSRRYFRLTKSAHSPLILMLDPPNDGNGTRAFEKIANHLQNQGLCAPEILFHDPTSGRMIISDLGPNDIANWLRLHPAQEAEIYASVVDLLACIHAMPAPDGLLEMTHKTAAEMTDLAATYYAKDTAKVSQLTALVHSAFDRHVDPALHFALRDFHAENLIWRPELTGLDRIGLLDFQDACLAPAGYDLMSLVRDARRDVSPSVAAAMTAQLQADAGGPTDAHLACVGAQRNLRILGIFARLADQGKPQYLQLVPRVWLQLMIDLAHPALHDLASWVETNLPRPKGL